MGERCEKLVKCPFYNDKMDMDKGIGKLYKQKYCEGDKTKCARWNVATKVGPTAVPNNLYPNMFEKAEKIIAEAGK